MEIPQLGIVADDLTGAMDCAGVLADIGLSAFVGLSPESGLPHPLPEVVCVNTQSRLLAEEQAAAAVRRAARRLVGLGCKRLYKKIDSTLRGHLGAEIAAMMDETQARLAIVCPAFPAMGRTVRQGALYLHGRPVRAAQEDTAGAAEVSVAGLLERQAGQRAGLVKLDDVASGAELVAASVESLERDGYRLVACDAETDEHMAAVAEAALEFPGAMMAGSAGLALALAPYLKGSAARQGDKPMLRAAPGPCLLVSGSLSPVTGGQLGRLAGLPGFQLFSLDGAALLSQDSQRSEMARVVVGAASALAGGEDAGIGWADSDSIQALLASHATPEGQVATLSSAVSQVVSDILQTSGVSALVLVGGETAHAVLCATGASGIEVAYQVLSGVPVGKTEGGKAAGRVVVTKAGGFGDEAALVEVIQHLRQLRRSLVGPTPLETKEVGLRP